MGVHIFIAKKQSRRLEKSARMSLIICFSDGCYYEVSLTSELLLFSSLVILGEVMRRQEQFPLEL